MAGHTKGPWSIGDRDGDYIMIDAPNHSGLASVVWQMEDDRLCGDNSPEKESNARLIASAPELLEAAQSGAECVLAAMGLDALANNEERDSVLQEIVRRLEAINEAITKATQP